MDRWTSTAPCVPPSELWGVGLGIPCPYWGWKNPRGPPHRPPACLTAGTNPSSAPQQSTRGVPHHPQTEPRAARGQVPQTLCLLPPRSQV